MYSNEHGVESNYITLDNSLSHKLSRKCWKTQGHGWSEQIHEIILLNIDDNGVKTGFAIPCPCS